MFVCCLCGYGYDTRKLTYQNGFMCIEVIARRVRKTDGDTESDALVWRVELFVVRLLPVLRQQAALQCCFRSSILMKMLVKMHLSTNDIGSYCCKRKIRELHVCCMHVWIG